LFTNLAEFETLPSFSPLPLQHHSNIFHHCYLFIYRFGMSFPLIICKAKFYQLSGEKNQTIICKHLGYQQENLQRHLQK
jgi:hypothetical protein